VYTQQQEEQQQQQQDAENSFLDPPFSRIKSNSRKSLTVIAQNGGSAKVHFSLT
jgi:16S rRNA G966 N2-methylase RsmD